MSNETILKSAVAFFFLFFLNRISIENGQQGISYNVLQLNADFVLHKICDLGAVSKVCWLVRRLVPKPFIFFFLRGIKNFFTKILAN